MRPLTLVLLATIAIGSTATLLAWRERPEPGATPLVALLVGQSWWSAFFVFELEASTLGAKVLWSDVQWVGVVLIPVAWLLFALEYTGKDRFTRPRYVALLSVIPAITVVLAMTGEYHNLLYVDSRLVERQGILVLSRTGGPWYWVIAAYTYILGLLGMFQLIGLVQSDALPFRGQSIALLVGATAPLASNVLFLMGVIPIPGLDPTPIAFTISGVAFLGAITRFRLLGTSPSPNRRASRLVFRRMQEGAIVVDSHDYLVDMNESAAAVLGTTPREALGYPASEVVPRYEYLPEDGATSDLVTISGPNGDRPYDVMVSRIDDFHGRTIGRVITFHDVSEHLRQQQRLEVLTRLVRHNIRTETNLIHGYADLMTGGDGAHNAAIVKDHALRIAEMGEKARQIIDMFEQGRKPAEPTSLASLLDDAVAPVRKAHPDVTVVCEPVPDHVYVAGVLEDVFSNLVENAAEHNTNPDPHVWVSVEARDERVRVAVADDGPGIDDYERSVLERGTETQLEHGSGLGLWLAKWGTDIGGGTISFEENSPTGSVVTVTVPRLSRDVGGQDRDDEAPASPPPETSS
ncbi:histidine kinase N-terminal 7TM domain-containing protein [Halobacteriaceae archaeon GCM10025711]